MFGIVKWFSDRKGYGFINASGEERDIFVHYSSINHGGHKTLLPNETVKFDVFETDKGLQARNVTRCTAPHPNAVYS